MEPTNSLLVVERMEVDAERPCHVFAEVRIGGRHEVVALDLSMPTLAAFERMPEELEYHRSARQAVVGVMMRRFRGEDFVLPIDLSEMVRESSEPWPLRASSAPIGGAGEASAAGKRVALKQTEHDDEAPDLLTVRLDFDGVPTVVVVDRRGGSRSPLRLRFAEGIHPWLLTPSDQRLLLSTIVGALP